MWSFAIQSRESSEAAQRSDSGFSRAKHHPLTMLSTYLKRRSYMALLPMDPEKKGAEIASTERLTEITIYEAAHSDNPLFIPDLSYIVRYYLILYQVLCGYQPNMTCASFGNGLSRKCVRLGRYTWIKWHLLHFHMLLVRLRFRSSAYILFLFELALMRLHRRHCPSAQS